jgi:molybdate transport system ATP-binding protein
MNESGLNVSIRQTDPISLDVNLNCAAGELLALVGPSGSGKSTVLRAIAGLYRVKHGKISCNSDFWLDTDAHINLSPQARRVGFVVQSFALFPHLTALENVMEAIGGQPRAERERRARDLIARVHLGGLEGRLPARLSGGQQQRVAVARALAREPNVLLLDEPFSAVDRVTRERLYRELAELRRELSMPVILVTHDFEEALLLADRMCVLSNGKILQAGDPHTVITQPESVQVAHVVGLRNVFRASVVAHVPDRNLTVIEWRRRKLEVRFQPAFAVGTPVTWAIPQGYLVLHDQDRTFPEALENRLAGTVSSFVRLGDNAVFTVDVDGAKRPPLLLSVPTRAAHRYPVAIGTEVTVSLLGEGIQLMPPDKNLTAELVMTL